MKKGEKMSPELRLKVSLSRKGKCLGNRNGFVKGQQSPWKGKHPSKETILKMRNAKLGKTSNWKGKKASPESRVKMSISRRNFFLRQNPNYDYVLDSRTRAGNKRIRRERIRKFGGTHTIGEWENLKAQYNWTCPCCKRTQPEIKLTRDHIIPLSNGGSDNVENIQPLCVSCNSKKNTRTIRY